MTSRCSECMIHRVTLAETQALADVRGYALADRIKIEGHARKRMRERGASYDDIRSALVTAKECQFQEEARGEARWKVIGWDMVGDDLSVIVELTDGVVVVTLY